MTPSRTHGVSKHEISPKLDLTNDIGAAAPDRRLVQSTGQKLPFDNRDGKTTSPKREGRHWRVQYLREISRVQSARGIAGVVPPYCPAGPPLVREPFDLEERQQNPPRSRHLSPLRASTQADYASSVTIRYGNTSSSDLERMPHAVSMPQSGFQALILCGPGIGLSTFTSVPSEHPKALISIANRPMVWYVLDWCYRMGVTDITLVTPPSSKDALAAALGQNPYLTSLPSPSPDLLAPKELEFTTPTAELLRLPEVQKVIHSDFLLLPCDLICDISGLAFLETYLTSLGGVGGAGVNSESSLNSLVNSDFGSGGEGGGRRGGLSIWYNTANREESVKSEECDFMGTTKLDSRNATPSRSRPDAPGGTLRKLVSTLPMSELWDTVEEEKGWKIRQSLLRKYGSVKCMTKFRDSHVYFFPYWVKEFAALNPDFESVSEDLVGTWANAEWRKPGYRARFGAQTIFMPKAQNLQDSQSNERSIEAELDLLALSSTQTTQHTPNTTPYSKQTVQLASRVQADSDARTISPDNDDNGGDQAPSDVPIMPPMLSYILPSDPAAPLVRRVDTTPLLLSISLLLAKISSIEESAAAKGFVSASPFAHAAKIAGTATIAPRTTISRADTLIDNNTTVSTQCVIKQSCIGSAVSIGQGARITGCVIMDGATVGEKCVLTNTVVGKKAKIGKECVLQTCEVQDGNVVADKTEGKGEKYLVGGLEDDMGDDEDDLGFDGKDEDDGDFDDEDAMG